MKNLKNLTLAALVCSANVQAFEEVEIEVLANSQHEECFYVENETALNYEYSTSSPLDFNVHFHDDQGMNFIVELAESTNNKETVKPLSAKQVYCLMWVNSIEKPATLTYQFTME